MPNHLLVPDIQRSGSRSQSPALSVSSTSSQASTSSRKSSKGRFVLKVPEQQCFRRFDTEVAMQRWIERNRNKYESLKKFPVVHFPDINPAPEPPASTPQPQPPTQISPRPQVVYNDMRVYNDNQVYASVYAPQHHQYDIAYHPEAAPQPTQPKGILKNKNVTWKDQQLLTS